MTENELRTLVEKYAKECKLANIFQYPWGNDKKPPNDFIISVF